MVVADGVVGRGGRDEVARDDFLALVNELIERVLAVGSCTECYINTAGEGSRMYQVRPRRWVQLKRRLERRRPSPTYRCSPCHLAENKQRNATATGRRGE